MGSRKDSKRIEKGWSSFFYHFSVRLLSVSYPFAIVSFFYPFPIILLSVAYPFAIRFLSYCYPFPILLRSCLNFLL